MFFQKEDSANFLYAMRFLQFTNSISIFAVKWHITSSGWYSHCFDIYASAANNRWQEVLCFRVVCLAVCFLVIDTYQGSPCFAIHKFRHFLRTFNL